MRTDGQKDMTKLIVVFRNFAKAPKAQSLLADDYSSNSMRCAKILKDTDRLFHVALSDTPFSVTRISEG
jgi:hypothetical protein